MDASIMPARQSRGESCHGHQGIVLLFHEGSESPQQIEHRTIDVSDTTEGALEEAKVLAQHVLADMQPVARPAASLQQDEKTGGKVYPFPPVSMPEAD